jgi:uncharacterized protein (DUF433 family)
MQISVELVLSLLAQGETVEAIVGDYPDLEAERHPGLHCVRGPRDR